MSTALPLQSLSWLCSYLPFPWCSPYSLYLRVGAARARDILTVLRAAEPNSVQIRSLVIGAGWEIRQFGSTAVDSVEVDSVDETVGSEVDSANEAEVGHHFTGTTYLCTSTTNGRACSRSSISSSSWKYSQFSKLLNERGTKASMSTKECLEVWMSVFLVFLLVWKGLIAAGGEWISLLHLRLQIIHPAKG